ncbi:unnamed protein product [Gongylonema pulchrum]|uniref:Uncharacterized protein n=1 Tax=Gongylonema pulchrum TaxID=637853 RepID=A0A183CWP8_9BILA|nr:unnamed protein product [Gongylonema pulchrum]
MEKEIMFWRSHECQSIYCIQLRSSWTDISNYDSAQVLFTKSLKSAINKGSGIIQRRPNRKEAYGELEPDTSRSNATSATLGGNPQTHTFVNASTRLMMQ